MRNALLALLAKEPAHGYELKQALEETFGDAWPPTNIGQIYTTLGRLERDGLVQSVHVAQEHRPDKRVYAVTPEGRRELDDWIATPTPGPRLRDEFFLKLILAQTAGLNSASDPRLLIERQRRAFLHSLRELNDLATRQDTRDNPAALLLIEGAILHLQADVQWLDLCESRLIREV
ncbi:MAG TPA: helix-turn-helix transcriptional regulator [Thermomicrobiales bacterium]|jgi:DNA-binding PadR family transcriptional regulator|nr:helix-turn-helix transcriptional regulator [Thermomicrobiales bacterium]